MMKSGWIVVAGWLAACTAKTPPPAAPAPWAGDTTLAPILNAPVMGRPQLERADSVASLLGAEFDVRLAAVVSDSTAPALIRTNALLLMSDRRVARIDPYIDAFESRDDRVRAAAIAGLRPFVNTWGSARLLARQALNDSSELVQTKALEVLGDDDVELLRGFATKTRFKAVAKIAQDLVAAAYERGAPLVAHDSSGRLERATASGHALSFLPAHRWPAWRAALGTILLTPRKGAPLRIADSVEVVNHVVPAFVTPEGDFLVYERGREVHVYDLKTRTSRRVGPGIAPRLLPFSPSFIYLRPKQTLLTPTGSTLKYEVVRANFADAKESVLGDLTTTGQYQVAGHYSPVRWMRVREHEGQFYLMGDQIEQFKLPSPFAG